MNIGATGVVVNEYGEVLLIQRDDTRTWAMPGGSLDAGELPTTGVAREVEEETGLKVLPVRLVGLDYWPLQPDGFLIFSFRCLVRGGNLQASAESLQVGYYNLNRPPGAMFGIHRERLEQALIHSGGPVAWRTLPITPVVRLTRFLLRNVVYPFKDWRRRLRGEEPFVPAAQWRVAAYAAVADDDGRILWVKGSDEASWQLPGGTTQEQEAPWETAVRRGGAISGAEIKLIDLAAVSVRPGRNEMVFIFVAEIDDRKDMTPPDAVDVAFFAQGEEPPGASLAHLQMVAELTQPRETTLFSVDFVENN
jgi:ADP-ribose pyrophosphatase YjhB (NUDIX family)